MCSSDDSQKQSQFHFDETIIRFKITGNRNNWTIYLPKLTKIRTDEMVIFTLESSECLRADKVFEYFNNGFALGIRILHFPMEYPWQ